MSLGSFLKLVEIQTKVASMIPFLLGTVYTIYRYNEFNVKNFILMFISLLVFDMATTSINNYYDYKRAKKTHGYNYESHNAIVRDDLNEKTVIGVIFLLLSIATLFGILLFLNTNIVVLVMGVVSFLVGIFYSFGPVPISRIPLGEIFSGLFMGFVIVFVSVYIHIFDQNVLSLVYENGVLNISADVSEILYIFLISLPAVNGIANIMLANNICDIRDDIENRRYTLPIYIGREDSLTLFKILYYMVYINLIILVLLRVEPLISLLLLVTLIPVIKNIRIFARKQDKKETFVLSVKNFILINVVHILLIGIGIIIPH